MGVGWTGDHGVVASLLVLCLDLSHGRVWPRPRVHESDEWMLGMLVTYTAPSLPLPSLHSALPVTLCFLPNPPHPTSTSGHVN